MKPEEHGYNFKAKRLPDETAAEFAARSKREGDEWKAMVTETLGRWPSGAFETEWR